MKIIYLFLLLLAFGCERDKSSDKEAESQALTEKYLKIDKISQSVQCTNAAEWKFTEIGVKPCGQVNSYIPYHKSIDEANFLKLINDYNKAQVAFYEKWGAVSDCTPPLQPKGISCVDGKAVFKI